MMFRYNLLCLDGGSGIIVVLQVVDIEVLDGTHFRVMCCMLHVVWYMVYGVCYNRLLVGGCYIWYCQSVTYLWVESVGGRDIALRQEEFTCMYLEQPNAHFLTLMHAGEKNLCMELLH